jgi:hypothetical protein
MERKRTRRLPLTRPGFRKLVIDGGVWWWKAFGMEKPVKVYDPQGKSHLVPVIEVSAQEHFECDCGLSGCDYQLEDRAVLVAMPGPVADYIRRNFIGATN